MLQKMFGLYSLFEDDQVNRLRFWLLLPRKFLVACKFQCPTKAAQQHYCKRSFYRSPSTRS